MEEERVQQPSRDRATTSRRGLSRTKLSLSFSVKKTSRFHIRKKKRRKEAQQKLQDAERRKRFEACKKRQPYWIVVVCCNQQCTRKEEDRNFRKAQELNKKKYRIFREKTGKRICSVCGAPPDSSAGPDESDKDGDSNEEEEPAVSGTTMYDSCEVRIAVTTTEISQEEEDPIERPRRQAPQLVGGSEKRKHNVSISKKQPFKKVAKKR